MMDEIDFGGTNATVDAYLRRMMFDPWDTPESEVWQVHPSAPGVWTISPPEGQEGAAFTLDYLGDAPCIRGMVLYSESHEKANGRFIAPAIQKAMRLAGEYKASPQVQP